MQGTEHLLQGKAFVVKYKSKGSASMKSSGLSAVQICILLYVVNFALKAFLFSVLSSYLLKTEGYTERYKLCYHWCQSSGPLFPCTHAMHIQRSWE